jgi:hypothetical protein
LVNIVNGDKMALSVWTKNSSFNLGNIPGTGKWAIVGELEVGEEYVINLPGNTDFTLLGATNNNQGTVFVATATGLFLSEFFISGKTYIIESLGTTNWNAVAGTQGVDYQVEDEIIVVSAGLGTGRAYLGNGIVSSVSQDERRTITIPLPVIDPLPNNVTFKVISGSLPRGLRISGSNITGTPFEVSRPTEYKFVIRASNGIEISDRTFTITIVGSDEPRWLTPEGTLPVGSNNAFYIIDSSFIDFQLSAIDTDTAAGQILNFFIASGEGELPPGLRLLPNGRITGFIQPLLAVPRLRDQGFYDTGLYDTVAYDFGYRSTNGYDSFVYESVTYDFSIPTLTPRKLNRNYEFIVTITDGDSITKRKFRIFVVGDDFFRADNVILQVGEGTYTADVTYVRAPIFTTPKYLGLRRANNYQTFKIDIFEGFYNELGPVIYELSPVNALINGVTQRESAGDNRLGSNKIRFIKSSGIPEVGQKINFNSEFPGATNKTYTITEVDVLGGDFYRLTIDSPLEVTIPNLIPIYIGDESKLPPGMNFDISNGEVFGRVPFQPAITKSYYFTIKAIRLGSVTENSISRRMFKVDILGEVESFINWTTPSYLGIINVGYPSSLFVEATTTYVNSGVLYTIEKGKLPPGLSLNLDGEIVGKVNQLRDQSVYKSFWKPITTYKTKNIVKIDRKEQIRSIIRRKNIATLVTEQNHDFKNKDIIKISSDTLDFNYYSGVEIFIDTLKLNSVISVEGSGSYYQVKFSIPTQNIEPLSPRFTLIKGTSAVVTSGTFNLVEQKSTSGNGTGAKFKIVKGNNGTFNYTGLVTITLLDPGIGYLPGDTITISGTDLNGLDDINDLTFTLLTGTEFLYKINGNSNSKYNGEFFSIESTTSTITLGFDEDPGTFGVGLISVSTGLTTFEAQTQIIPLNYFNYFNSGSGRFMKTVTGTATGTPLYYRATSDHISDIVFDPTNWEKYNFPEKDLTPTTFTDYINEFNTVLDRTFIDSNETTFDRIYNFTIKARDVLGYSAVSRDFSLTIEIPNDSFYSNIMAKPFMKPDQRSMFREFINNSDIFDPRYIYRLGDSNFGIQKDLMTLVYAGIETKQAVEYISAMGLNHKPKRFNLGSIKKAVAKEPGTNNVVYEVIYIELLDPLEKEKKHLPFKIVTSPSNIKVTIDNTNDFYKTDKANTDNPFWSRPIPFNSSIDRTDVLAGDPGTVAKFPSSISIWRKRLRSMEATRRERNYLPLWMRSIQPGTYVELDYVAAVPLCYCKPGTADEILLNIKNSEFDFKLLDYTIDRYIIDAVQGYYEDKYLVFRNDRTTIA